MQITTYDFLMFNCFTLYIHRYAVCSTDNNLFELSKFFLRHCIIFVHGLCYLDEGNKSKLPDLKIPTQTIILFSFPSLALKMLCILNPSRTHQILVFVHHWQKWVLCIWIRKRSTFMCMVHVLCYTYGCGSVSLPLLPIWSPLYSIFFVIHGIHGGRNCL